MMCPSGHDVEFPVTVVPPLSVCPQCGRTVVLTDGSARFAVAEDTRMLTVDQQKALKQLRPKNG